MVQTIQDELARVHAQRELNRLDALRACSKARATGMTQVEIARSLGVSQPEVHRMLRKADSFPELIDRTPREVILDFHAGLLDHADMMAELKSWPFTFSGAAEPDNPLGPSTRGSWEDVVDAVHRDLLLVEDYEELFAAHQEDSG
ncbi:sugar-binding transcriptional regulator [Tersicoccus phoenicis]|uniref:hypothetical protein n=1 Tax=Tersicoccus phoenicis TaxID=554083 RepID=UPI000A06E8A3|nr:hypothetical protein [Tersicoccus phoenicis]